MSLAALDPQVWWHLSRATGIVAWALGVSSVLWGVALSTRALGSKPRAPWLLDLHRFLGGATVLFVALHVGSIVADSYVHFGVADVLVPFASGWKASAVAWGIIAFWMLLAVEATSLVRNRLPKRLWHGVHLASYLVAVLATAHLLTAGTDAGNPLLQVAAFAWVPITVFFLLYRWLAPARRSARDRVPAAARVVAAASPDRLVVGAFSPGPSTGLASLSQPVRTVGGEARNGQLATREQP
jgi:DMSO/TMAO reductase YedYZ heme-binding membrane subunit